MNCPSVTFFLLSSDCEFRDSPIDYRQEASNTNQQQDNTQKDDMVKFGKLLVMGAQDFGKELDKDYIKDVLATGYDDLTGN